MSKDFKCDNCNTIQKEKIFSNWNYDIRYNCSICGKLCKDCHSTSLFSYGECKGCGKEAQSQNYRNGRWQDS